MVEINRNHFTSSIKGYKDHWPRFYDGKRSRLWRSERQIQAAAWSPAPTCTTSSRHRASEVGKDLETWRHRCRSIAGCDG